MKNLKIINKKGSPRIIYTGSRIQELNIREYNDIISGEITGLLPFEVMQNKKTVTLSAQLSGLTVLDVFLSNTVLSKKMFSLLLDGALGVFDDLERHHFNKSLLLYDLPFVYIDPSTWQLFFVYLPLRPLNTEQKPKDFFKGLIRCAAFDPSGNTDYVQSYIGIVNEGADVSLFVLREYLRYIGSAAGEDDSGSLHLIQPHPADRSQPYEIDIPAQNCSAMPDHAAASGSRSFSVNEDENGMVTVFRAGSTKKAFLIPDNTDARIAISKSPFRIGKLLDSSDYRIESHAVSRKHADIVKDQQQYYVIDLYSTNGTTVNGRRIQSGVKECLKSGDVICFADAAFRFILES